MILKSSGWAFNGKMLFNYIVFLFAYQRRYQQHK